MSRGGNPSSLRVACAEYGGLRDRVPNEQTGAIGGSREASANGGVDASWQLSGFQIVATDLPLGDNQRQRHEVAVTVAEVDGHHHCRDDRAVRRFYYGRFAVGGSGASLCRSNHWRESLCVAME